MLAASSRLVWWGAAYVSPMTALGMVETMRAEGHRGLIHTAAASSLGQMLIRLCNEDGVPLVNVVRSPAKDDIRSRILQPAIENVGSSTRFWPSAGWFRCRVRIRRAAPACFERRLSCLTGEVGLGEALVPP